MKVFQIKAKISAQFRIKENFWLCELFAPEIAKIALPGQFVNIRVSDGFEPLLRRPISIHGVSSRRVRIFYQALGKGTQILSQKKPGEYLDVIGPLGNGFQFPSFIVHRPSSIVLVAGGMGVAPLLFLAEKMKVRQSLVLIGARTKNQILCADEFIKLGCKVKIATDDGSVGFKGRVTELLEEIITKSSFPRKRESMRGSLSGFPIKSFGNDVMYACGPKPMLKEISRISIQEKIPARVSLEEHMACGIGACLGCVVKVRGQKSEDRSQKINEFEYKRVCKDGPVFSANEIIWED